MYIIKLFFFVVFLVIVFRVDLDFLLFDFVFLELKLRFVMLDDVKILANGFL